MDVVCNVQRSSLSTDQMTTFQDIFIDRIDRMWKIHRNIDSYLKYNESDTKYLTSNDTQFKRRTRT
jgi:hypothetical protein